MVLKNIDINEHNVGCAISIPAPSKVIVKHNQCHLNILSWPKICLEWIQIIHLLQEPWQLLLNYFPSDQKGKSRMKVSSNGLLKRSHTTASFKARGTLFKKPNHNPNHRSLLGLPWQPRRSMDLTDSQTHSSEDHIYVISIYRIKPSSDSIIGLMSQATHLYLLRLQDCFLSKSIILLTTTLKMLLESISPIYKCNKGWEIMFAKPNLSQISPRS